jgi:hypothetical protein
MESLHFLPSWVNEISISGCFFFGIESEMECFDIEISLKIILLKPIRA